MRQESLLILVRARVDLSLFFHMAKPEFLSFEDARGLARGLGLKSKKEWNEYRKIRPENIPSAPDRAYNDNGWISWGDWLGTGNTHKKEFLPFKEARKFVRGLGLKSKREWLECGKNRSTGIPLNANIIYKGCGWINWGDFLGNGNAGSLNRVYLSFEEARKFVRGLGLKSAIEWFECGKTRPNNIPSIPHKIYKDKGWSGWGDWLGNKSLPFEEARKIIHSLGLKSSCEWIEYRKNRPNNIPSNPNRDYKDGGWIGWGDFLGYSK